MHEAVYLHVPPEGGLPPWTGHRPFNAVVVASCAVTDGWQDQVSHWLVKSGSLYMMAWGVNCSIWDDAVDHAVRKFYEHSDVPDAGFVMTTWHTDDPLEEVLWYALFCGNTGYAGQPLELTLIIDISSVERSSELLGLFEQSRDYQERAD